MDSKYLELQAFKQFLAMKHPACGEILKLLSLETLQTECIKSGDTETLKQLSLLSPIITLPVLKESIDSYPESLSTLVTQITPYCASRLLLEAGRADDVEAVQWLWINKLAESLNHAWSGALRTRSLKVITWLKAHDLWITPLPRCRFYIDGLVGGDDMLAEVISQGLVFNPEEIGGWLELADSIVGAYKSTPEGVTPLTITFLKEQKNMFPFLDDPEVLESIEYRLVKWHETSGWEIERIQAFMRLLRSRE